jgi:ABC-type multidrug transport system ATPase subunit
MEGMKLKKVVRNLMEQLGLEEHSKVASSKLSGGTK